MTQAFRPHRASPPAMAEAEERLVIERCKRGDKAAFDQLIAAYERRVYNLAYRLSGNYDEANDISVDAFMRVFQAIRLFRGEANFSTWLYRIVTNVFLDRRKRNRNRNNLSLEEYVDLEESSVERQVRDLGPGPGTSALSSERSECLDDAIARLPDYQRAMVVLYHRDGLSYEEIASVMSLPIGTVKSRLNRARLVLREALAERTELFNV